MAGLAHKPTFNHRGCIFFFERLARTTPQTWSFNGAPRIASWTLKRLERSLDLKLFGALGCDLPGLELHHELTAEQRGALLEDLAES